MFVSLQGNLFYKNLSYTLYLYQICYQTTCHIYVRSLNLRHKKCVQESDYGCAISHQQENYQFCTLETFETMQCNAILETKNTSWKRHHSIEYMKTCNLGNNVPTAKNANSALYVGALILANFGQTHHECNGHGKYCDT